MKKQTIKSVFFTGTIYGNWVKGLKYKQTCRKYHHYHCCVRPHHKKIHFKFFSDHLNQMDPATEFGKAIKNKNILLVGDSLLEQLTAGIIEVLNLTQHGDKKIPTFPNKFTMLRKTSHKHNGTLTYVLAYIFVLDGESDYNRRYVVKEAILRNMTNQNDIIVWNVGIHYNSLLSIRMLHSHIRKISNILMQLTANSSKTVVLRSTVPQHFTTNPNTGFYEGTTGCLLQNQNQVTNATLIHLSKFFFADRVSPYSNCSKTAALFEGEINLFLRAIAGFRSFFLHYFPVVVS